MSIPKRAFEILPSAARVAAPTPVDIELYGETQNCRGILVIVDVTAVTATPGLTLSILALDPVSGKAVALLTASSPLTGTGTAAYLLGAGVGTAGAGITQVAAFPLPPSVRFSVAHADADSATYSVGGLLLY